MNRYLAFLRSTRIALLAIVLLGLALRTWGVNFGLPYLYHPDEPAIVTIAQQMFKTGDLNPHFFNYPTLSIYVNAAAYIPYFLIGKLMGVFQTPSDIGNPVMLVMGVGYEPFPTAWLMERMLTVITGTASILVVFAIGRALTGDQRAGLIAAALMAVSPTTVALSRYITVDTYATFFVLVSFWGAARVLRVGDNRGYVIAGIGAGLAAASKYNSGLVLLTLPVAHWLNYGHGGLKDMRMILAGLMAAVAFLTATPFALLDFQTFMAGIRFESLHYLSGHAGMEGDSPQWYLSYLALIEGPVAALAVIEMARAVRSRSKPGLLLMFFPMLYFAFISAFVVRNDRTLLPLIPFVFLMTGSFLSFLVLRYGRKTRAFRLVAAAAALVVLFSLVRTVGFTTAFVSVDSRMTARAWIAENIPAGARLAIESYSPYVDPLKYSVTGFGRMTDHSIQWYRDNKYEYLVFSQPMYGRFYADPAHYATEIQQYDELFAMLDEVKVFNDGGLEVRIYALRT
jgi:4-amino-4-deoxy-L-arabinose transferase-like glycosyltransferase